MTASKLTTASLPGPAWTNQVVRTADGQLIVRGVDVPSSGPIWERVCAGKALPASVKPVFGGREIGPVLTAVTSKSKAFAIARQAGLVAPAKSGSYKK